jgi:dTDP-4-dehydrorhamnose reductase
MRLLIIGGTGLLGQYLVLEAYQRGWEVTATYHDNDAKIGTRTLVHMDVRNESEVSEVLRSVRPEAVILAAGITDLDRCETNPQEAWEVNAEGALNVAAACKLNGIKLLYVSTDAVFNGQRGERYYEFDTPDPLNIYAQTKLEAERITLDADQRNIVARVSLLYGWNRLIDKENFVTWVLARLRTGETVNLFEDRRTCPTYAPHCAQVLLKVLEKGGEGTYHVAGADCLSRFEMGLKVAEVFDLSPSLCMRGSVANAELAAKRGKDLCLSTQKVEGEFDIRMMSFEDGLKAMRSTDSSRVDEGD